MEGNLPRPTEVSATRLYLGNLPRNGMIITRSSFHNVVAGYDAPCASCVQCHLGDAVHYWSVLTAMT